MSDFLTMSNQLKELFYKLIALLKIERPLLPVFFFLIGLSTIFWVLTVLSKEYTATISSTVSFENYPSDKLLVEENEVVLQMQVKAPGFALLAHQFKFFGSIPLNVDNFMRKRRGKVWEYFWIGDQSLSEVQEALPTNMQLLHVQPNRIDLVFGDKAQKVIPISLKSDISFEGLFRQKGTIQLQPDHITVSGPKAIVEAIESISTNELNLHNLSKYTQGNISLEEPKHQELTYSHQEVAFEVTVEQFTEGKATIPIQVSDVPRGYELKLFPEEVSVHYVVSLDDFDLVDKQMFMAQVKYDEEKSRLTVKLNKEPDLIENIRLKPTKVEYILIQK